MILIEIKSFKALPCIKKVFRQSLSIKAENNFVVLFYRSSNGSAAFICGSVRNAAKKAHTSQASCTLYFSVLAK